MKDGQMAGNMKVGNDDNLWFSVDIDSPTLIVKTVMNPTITPGAYNPIFSPDVNMLDPFRYRDGSQGLIGYYGSDFGCMNMQPGNVSNSSGNAMCSPKPVAVFGAQFGVEKIAPWSGVLGLGPQTAMFGANLISQLSEMTMGASQKVWSFYSGPFLTNRTQLFIGGINP